MGLEICAVKKRDLMSRDLADLPLRHLDFSVLLHALSGGHRFGRLNVTVHEKADHEDRRDCLLLRHI